MAQDAGQQLAPDWSQLVVEATANRPPRIMAETFIRKWDTGSRPVRLRCADGNNYVVKGRQVGRIAFNDQVAARLGRAISAPVPDAVALVEVPQELIAANPGEMGHMQPGVGHGTKMIENTSERLAVQRNEPYNRPRFALLSVFFGWLGGTDTQYIYNNTDPYLVHSVDHGHFFYGPNWTSDSLRAAPQALAQADLIQQCGLTEPDLGAACGGLRAIGPDQIAAAIAACPDEWGVTNDERISLAEYVYRRRAEIIAAYPA
jgi:hypothetical protein